MNTLLLLLSLGTASGAELAGVTLPDTAQVGEKTLVLNGMGLREKFWIDVYVGGLYLPEKTTSGAQAIEADVPKRILMHFIYSEVSRDQIVDTFREGLAAQPGHEQHAAKMDQLAALIEGSIKKGDVIGLDYVPGKGLTFSLNGQAKGTIEGADFMRAIWGIYLGDSPPSAKFKNGLLGG